MCGYARAPEAVRKRPGSPYPGGRSSPACVPSTHRARTARSRPRQMLQLRCQQMADIIQCHRSTHGHTRVLSSLIRRSLDGLPPMILLTNASATGHLHHTVPCLRGTASLNANPHAVCYFTALLCGIPLSN